uniref:Uncharacterized protein n=1 Tax=Manihot esculenta TaxID=3983 RepID=A0A2C9VJF5_MANES
MMNSYLVRAQQSVTSQDLPEEKGDSLLVFAYDQHFMACKAKRKIVNMSSLVAESLLLSVSRLDKLTNNFGGTFLKILYRFRLLSFLLS